MPTLGFGIDFGTSNSAVAMAQEGGQVRLAEWALPASLVPKGKPSKRADTMPTVLFAPAYDRQIHIGYDAIAHYLFTGLDGRFMQSIKAFLPQSTFSKTGVHGKNYSIEELVSVFLRKFVRSAEESLGTALEGPVVLGRPARFSLDPAEDKLAEDRLRKAAELAGLGEVRLLIEPVAAALAYEATLSKDEIVFVVDLGGGTSDFTLMQVGPSSSGRVDRRSSILSSGGLPVAGDCFDGEIVRARLFDPLGYGATYRAMTDRTPVPHWIWQKLKRWNHVSFLKTKKYMDFLEEVHETSDRADELAALIRIVDEDMGYLLFRAVERAKREVAEKGRATIADTENDLPVRATMTKRQFEEATADLVADIEKTAVSVLAAAGRTPETVDAVFMTGGTSLVPEVRNTFARLFGESKLKRERTFTSVVDGLARAATTDL
ncbi:Hsp70 family protein [Myxococcota bacterium]|nr:Hsp70 family protein [Myxococcota bacterium]